MKISVITISFNSAATIEDTILSVTGQTYPDVEYIIVDGGSTDGTQDIIKKYRAAITAFTSEPDKGIYDAMNKGLKLCSGELVGILNSDDVYASAETLQQVAEKIKKENTDSLYGDLVYVHRDDLSKIFRYWKSGEYKHGKFLKGWMPPHPAFFAKRKVYEQFGCFNLQLKTSADYELMLRFLHKEKISVCYLPEVITKMRVGGASNISLLSRLKANKEDRLAWKINGLKPGTFTIIRKPLSKVFQFVRKGGK